MYEDLQWTTGSSSGGRNGIGGTEALVGINAGDRTNAITVPGSRTPNITNVVNTSNIGIPGIWMFKVDSCTYICTYVYTYMYDMALLCAIVKYMDVYVHTYIRRYVRM